MIMPLLSFAGVIRLLPEAHIEFTNGIPLAVVQITNLGDEPFRVLSIDALLQGVRTNVSPGESLVPDEVSQHRLVFPGMLLKPDATPAVIRIKYTHPNGNVFSALTLGLIPPSGKTEDSWVSANLSSLSIGRTGKITIQMILLEDVPSEVKVRLILPDEFTSESTERKVTLEPDAKRIETFEVVNHSGVPGSTYTIYAIVERQVNGAGQCTTFSGNVKVDQIEWIGQSYTFWAGITAFMLLGFMSWAYFGRGSWSTHPLIERYFDGTVLTVLSVFILWQCSPLDLILNTTPVGGDTPAHLYLVSHLKDQLLQHGRIISWAGGWWCGFPMFQYYFVLPYLVAALLSFLIPLNIAFKAVSVAGMVFTPCCAYWAARIWRLPRPGPVLMALAMVPLLFVHSHTMWGVNTSSTLAGMIANSWSFALMLPALALGSRDISGGVIRGRTVLMFVLVLASHFFTSVIMFMTLAMVPILNLLYSSGRGERWAAFCRGGKVLVVETMLAMMLMGWWLIPLIAKSGSSMDFGVNWELSLLRSFPAYIFGISVFAIVAMVVGIRRSMPVVWILFWMCVVSVALFKGGYAISSVFVNVRLWPFIFYAIMALGAVGLGVLLERVRGGAVITSLLVLVVLIAVLMSDSVGGLYGPGLTRSWAKWNYSGLENKPSAAVFEKLMPLLKGSPGRLANDLCEENNQLGSSRVFELVPYLTGKPILEGGLVNSALGSMYSYYVQGETSPSCAGFPPIVTPTTFDFPLATRHLELFNVKHFIARSSIARQALASMTEWHFLAREGEWELYELMTHEGKYVFIPPRLPHVVETYRWKECSLEWLYTPLALDQFLLWKTPGMILDRTNLVTLTEPEVLKALVDMRQTNSPQIMTKGHILSQAGTQCISGESVSDDTIRFRTTALGLPHIIKVTWFPNWKVRGAKQVYCISPGFMCVFPDRADVELYYGSTWSDVVGYSFTTLGFCLVVVWLLMSWKKRGYNPLT